MPYSERYIAFVDILGFGDVIKGNGRDPARVDELPRTLKELAHCHRLHVVTARTIAFVRQALAATQSRKSPVSYSWWLTREPEVI
jgi:hypothetical protein